MSEVHFLSEEMTHRIFRIMKQKEVTSSDLCREIGCGYPDFKLVMDGKRRLYGKWQRKIAKTLEVDRKDLFREFYN